MKYYKYHALGNDYIVMNPAECALSLTPERIRHICHRNFGVGSDGILYGPVEINGGRGLRIYNPDGGEAEKSGSGIRIFSRYLLDQKLVSESTFTLETLGGHVGVELLDDAGERIRVAMGRAEFESTRIPVAGRPREVVGEVASYAGGTYRITCLSVGNPHCVIPVPQVTAELAHAIGPIVEQHPMFPNRINMQLLEVIDRTNIKIEIWERGAGYTLASGTSSCAAACAAYKLGLVDEHIAVHMQGGVISIDLSPDGMVYMTGGVTAVGMGSFAPQFVRELTEMQK